MAERSQADKLQMWRFTDQHGRTFAATIDMDGYRGKVNPPDKDGKIKITRERFMGFVTPPVPIGWQPPFPELAPPPQVMAQRFDDPYKIDIDYAAWRGMCREAMQEYEQGLRILANERYPSNAGEVIENPPPDLIKLAGRRPMHEDFVIAMEQGNRWSLGLVSPKTGMHYPTPAWAQPLLGTLGSTYKRVLSASEAAAKFADEDEPELTEDDVDWTGTAFDERFQDIEDAVDPQATGGKRVPVKSPRIKRGAAAIEG